MKIGMFKKFVFLGLLVGFSCNLQADITQDLLQGKISTIDRDAQYLVAALEASASMQDLVNLLYVMTKMAVWSLERIYFDVSFRDLNFFDIYAPKQNFPSKIVEKIFWLGNLFNAYQELYAKKDLLVAEKNPEIFALIVSLERYLSDMGYYKPTYKEVSHLQHFIRNENVLILKKMVKPIAKALTDLIHTVCKATVYKSKTNELYYYVFTSKMVDGKVLNEQVLKNDLTQENSFSIIKSAYGLYE